MENLFMYVATILLETDDTYQLYHDGHETYVSWNNLYYIQGPG